MKRAGVIEQIKNKEKISFYRTLVALNKRLSAIGMQKENMQTYSKVILVNISDNTIQYFDKGIKLGEFKISRGNDKFPTPTGRFRIINKSEMMWSNLAQKWMPYWMEFYGEGLYGIHAFPLDEDMNQLYDESSLGVAMSGGCVRLMEKDIKEIYKWADIETRVFIFDGRKIDRRG